MKKTSGIFEDKRPSVCGICFKGCSGLIFRDPNIPNAKLIGACSMDHLDRLKQGMRGDLNKRKEKTFVVPRHCLRYAVDQAKPFIKKHGPHLNKWEKDTVDDFVRLIIVSYKKKELEVPF